MKATRIDFAAGRSPLSYFTKKINRSGKQKNMKAARIDFAAGRSPLSYFTKKITHSAGIMQLLREPPENAKIRLTFFVIRFII